MKFYKNLSSHYLFIFLFYTQIAYSQVDTIWTKQFSYGNNNRPFDVIETIDSSYMLIGYSFSNTSSESILLKTDLAGNTKWVKKFNTLEYGRFIKMLVNEENEIYVVGSSYNFSKLYKFDLQGDIIWSLLLNNFEGKDTITTMPEDSLLQISDMIKGDNNGVFILGGYGAPDAKLWLAKININGEFEWANVIHYPLMIDSYDFSFIKSSEGFFITANEGGGTGRVQFIRTNNLGKLIEGKAYKPDNVISQTFNSICYVFEDVPDSGYVLTGEQMGNLSLIRTDIEGNVLWSKNYSRFSDAMNIGYDIINSPQGGWILIGGTDDYNAPKSFIIQTSLEGSIIWDNVYSSSYGKSISTTSDNGFIACGIKNDKDIWMLKLDVTPLVVISGKTLWNDPSWNGIASGHLDGSSSSSPNGFPIVKYEWSINDSIVGNQSIVDLNLPTGTTEVTLKITDESGVSGMKSIPIQVCSYKIETNGAITSSVSSIGDSIFFATSTDDQIYCFDRNNNLKWTLLTGGDIQSTTTIGPNNKIYVGSGDTRLYNFNLDGNFLWDKPVGGIVTASPAITKNGNIYVGTSTNRLYSINSEDGSINWNYLTNGSIMSSASISKNGDIYFGSNDKYFYSINSAGDLNWKFKANSEINSSPAIDNNGDIYFGSKDGYLYSLSDSGTIKWSYKTNGEINSSPVLDENGNCYFGSEDGNFYALTTNKQLLWKFNAESPINGNPSIALNGDIIFGCDDGKIIALKNNGKLNWYYQTNAAVKAAPLITADGRIYVGSSDWSIYGFIDPNYTNISERITKLQWPTFQKDNQRTGSLLDIETSVKSIQNNSLSNNFNLYQNYPNPFNPSTNIQFGLAEASHVEFYIFNITGEKIRTISEGKNNPGYYSISWDGLNDRNQQVGSGIYIFQMKATGLNKTFTKSIKMIKLK